MSRGQKRAFQRRVAEHAKRLLKSTVSGEFRGALDGADQRYLSQCMFADAEGGLGILLTRDCVGGQRFLHLCISPVPGETTVIDRDAERAWLMAVFGDNLDRVWGEHARSTPGQHRGMRHWRLPCDETADWNATELDAAVATEFRRRRARPALEILAVVDQARDGRASPS